MKKVSVIVPCYNVEKQINRCVRSLTRQTLGMEDMELIFVDDASTDRTMERLTAWEAKYPESILVVHCEQNGRQGTARNIGIHYSTGAYIGFVDADDYVEKEMFQVLYETAVRENCEVAGCLSVREWEDGSVAIPAIQTQDAGQVFYARTEEERQKNRGRGGTGGGVWSRIYRRELIFDHQLWFPEGLAYEDNYWGTFLGYAVKSWCVVDRVMYHYVVNRESTIVKRNSIRTFDRLKIELMKLEEYEKRGLLEKEHDRIEFDFLKGYFINTLHIVFTRFDVMPYDMIYEMQKTVKKLFPNYLENPQVKKLNMTNLSLLSLVEVPLNAELIDRIAQAYNEGMPVE